MKETIKKDREEFEKFLSDLIKRPIFVPEMDVFASKCGCFGIMIMVRGVLVDEVEILKKRIVEKLKEISKNYDINPNWIFVRVIPSSDDVVSFGVRELCGMCKEEYTSKTPRPELTTLYLRN